MRIGILTQPLYNNYGGILQNYALQSVLKRMGHESITLDCIHQNSKLRWFLSVAKSVVLWPRKNHRRPFPRFPKPRVRNKIFNDFVESNLTTTHFMTRYPRGLVRRYHLDAIIVGSDQVWRPTYNPHIEDSFLAFAQHDKIRRVAYAASFGVDKWEFTPNQTKRCKALAKRFDAISVREYSGVELCEKYLGVTAQHVVDPTLLLLKEDYEKLLDDNRPAYHPYLAAYILDPNEENRRIVYEEAEKKKLEVKFFSAGKDAKLSIGEWLAIFHDASFVVTDSFHGTVFSIIFGKEFICLTNKGRGNSRFDSLLKMYYNNTIGEMREKSLLFLSNQLR